MSHDARLRIVLGIFLLFVLAAGATGVRHARGEEASHTSFREWTDARLTASVSELSRSTDATERVRQLDAIANQHGTYASRPPAPLLALTLGQSDLQAGHDYLNARLVQGMASGDAVSHPLALLVGRIDLAFVAIYLYPLVILAICADLIASERDTGRLRLVLAQAVSGAAIIGAKLAARLALVAAFPLLVLLSAFWTTDGSFSSLVRVALWTAVVFTYGLVWLAVGFAASARGFGAAATMVSAAALWIVSALLAPVVVSVLARTMHPLPSGVEYDANMRAATRSAVLEGSQQLGRFLEDHPSTGTGVEGMQQYAMLQRTRDLEVARRMAPVEAAFAERTARQRAFVLAAQFVSPTAVLYSTLAEISGTGHQGAEHYRTQAVRFQESWSSFFSPTLTASDARIEAAATPRFIYEEEPLGEIVGAAVLPSVYFLFLTGLALGIGAAGYRGLM